MATSQRKQKASASFEYFLYAAIIAETGLAAFVYKIIFRDPDLARFNIYFGIFYIGFLAWSIVQLNNVHRRRKLVEATQPADLEETAEPEQARPVLGLSAAQLVIVAVVFLTALATFSWALRLLR
jgi:hypothetical protein